MDAMTHEFCPSTELMGGPPYAAKMIRGRMNSPHCMSIEYFNVVLMGAVLLCGLAETD